MLAEVVFERVNPGDLHAVLAEFVDRPGLNPADEARIVAFAAERGNDAVFIHPLVLVAGGLRVQDGASRILRYGDGTDEYDLEINWQTADMSNRFLRGWIEAVHARAIEVASRFGIASYYAGLEPACDADTRFFSGTIPGPFRLE